MISLQNVRLLVYTAHPDDEVLGAGGTIGKSIENGCEVHVYAPGTGIHSRRNVEPDEIRLEQLKILREDAVVALGRLGVPEANVRLGGFADNEMDGYTQLEIIHELEKVVQEVRPDVVVTHHWRCTNIDHRMCYDAAVVATRPTPHSRIALLSCEIPSSTGYLRPVQFEPTFYVGLDERHVDAKIAAMQTYRTEARPDPHPRSPEVLRAVAKVRGSESGFSWAEAFQVVRAFG